MRPARLAIPLALTLATAAAFPQTPAATQSLVKGCGPRCDTFGSPDAASAVIFLHGTSGAAAYSRMAQRLAAGGVYVLYPHYLEVRSSHGASDNDYAAWAAFIDGIARQAAIDRPGRPVIAFGVSLGASVALAAGTEDPFIHALVDWSGSLTDAAFHNASRVPPMLILHGSSDSNVPVLNAQQLIRLCQLASQQCESQIYLGDGHIFPQHIDDAWGRTFAFLRSQAALTTPARPMPTSGNLSSPTHP